MKLGSFFSVFFGCMILIGCSGQSTEPAPISENKKQSLNRGISQASTNVGSVSIHNYYLPPKYSYPRTNQVTHVMIHFISNAVQKPQNPYNVEDVYRIFLTYGVSANYMIGRNGEIYRLVSEDRVAFHAGKGMLPGFPEYQNKMNEYSIGIEMLAIGTRDEMLSIMPEKTYGLISPANIGYTDAQYYSLNRLLNEIIKRHPTIQRNRKHIVGHNEYAPDRKKNPGKLFDWSRINISQPYTVKPGDTLWNISKKFGVSIQAIIKYNNLNPNTYLKVGQKLIIPQ
ncbi:N-acetylmuramoyl-L-alanine amidase [Paenibacillus sp. LHD-117]|uniref:N-acetylmuramoyl-L-alanine amidase n=1 Tax=Paenibacillus sp. LHD-117 TaxID=3071412 RepID=UPI0027E0BEE2|nr:N-acetylmuramoyl-L-alanine amidase [Paenibacillus sp. LHD-117]MDQ6421641.1 N-acetylmuramoyl-L-alanine amidase [Paenibacillus sp. LHD-117]